MYYIGNKSDLVGTVGLFFVFVRNIFAIIKYSNSLEYFKIKKTKWKCKKFVLNKT